MIYFYRNYRSMLQAEESNEALEFVRMKPYVLSYYKDDTGSMRRSDIDRIHRRMQVVRNSNT